MNLDICGSKPTFLTATPPHIHTCVTDQKKKRSSNKIQNQLSEDTGLVSSEHLMGSFWGVSLEMVNSGSYRRRKMVREGRRESHLWGMVEKQTQL